ncbi:Kinase-like protein [Parasponia andersonii]|uniref:Kinase-like protein n=1 Tax=Parasponia andersonii TaxID=3476 RepID=A0A2P5BKJ2_PARAD|nr:Kinase-like protein [Parasponia andersonii]
MADCEITCDPSGLPRGVWLGNGSHRVREENRITLLEIPDFYAFVPVDDANGCYTWCLNNCSYAAYGIGCLVWSKSLIDILEFLSGGEDLFLRLAQTELGENDATFKDSLYMCTISYLFPWLDKETTEQFGSTKTGDLPILTVHNAKRDPSELCTFDLDSILVAANHFNIKNKLGQGGFGSVYKRRNLVKRLGFFIEEEENILVLELMPNRSLDTFIFELNWATRFNIIHGVARGLVYLCRDS